MFDPVATSVLFYEHTFVQQYTLCEENPGFEIVQESVKKGMHNGNVQQNPLCAASCFHLSPVLAYVFLSRGKSSTVQCTVFFYTPAQVDAPIMYSSINRLYAKNPVFEIVHEESVKVYHLHMCVCVFFPSILDIKFVGRTSRGHTGERSHRIFNPPSFCGACLDFCREKDSAIPFPRRP